MPGENEEAEGGRREKPSQGTGELIQSNKLLWLIQLGQTEAVTCKLAIWEVSWLSTKLGTKAKCVNSVFCERSLVWHH